jgi:hypothetical protein
MEHSRAAELSTKVSGAWTFKSQFTNAITLLPLSVVRFLLELDDQATAHGRVVAVPLKVDQQDGTSKVRHLTVEASFDDGATWCQAPVAGDRAIVRHPKRRALARSVRATAGRPRRRPSAR